MSRVASVEVDKQSCLSSGRCIEAAPEAFRFDEDFLAEATDAAPALPEEKLAAIERGCPGLAIHLNRESD